MVAVKSNYSGYNRGKVSPVKSAGSSLPGLFLRKASEVASSAAQQMKCLISYASSQLKAHFDSANEVEQLRKEVLQLKYGKKDGTAFIGLAGEGRRLLKSIKDLTASNTRTNAATSASAEEIIFKSFSPEKGAKEELLEAVEESKQDRSESESATNDNFSNNVSSVPPPPPPPRELEMKLEMKQHMQQQQPPPPPPKTHTHTHFTDTDEHEHEHESGTEGSTLTCDGDGSSASSERDDFPSFSFNFSNGNGSGDNNNDDHNQTEIKRNKNPNKLTLQLPSQLAAQKAAVRAEITRKQFGDQFGDITLRQGQEEEEGDEEEKGEKDEKGEKGVEMEAGTAVETSTSGSNTLSTEDRHQHQGNQGQDPKNHNKKVGSGKTNPYKNKTKSKRRRVSWGADDVKEVENVSELLEWHSDEEEEDNDENGMDGEEERFYTYDADMDWYKGEGIGEGEVGSVHLFENENQDQNQSSNHAVEEEKEGRTEMLEMHQEQLQLQLQPPPPSTSRPKPCVFINKPPLSFLGEDLVRGGISLKSLADRSAEKNFIKNTKFNTSSPSKIINLRSFGAFDLKSVTLRPVDFNRPLQPSSLVVQMDQQQRNVGPISMQEQLKIALASKFGKVLAQVPPTPGQETEDEDWI